MAKDGRPYNIQKAEQKVFSELAMKVFEELKMKDSTSVLEDDLKKIIFEQIEKEIKEIIDREVKSFPDTFFAHKTGVVFVRKTRYGTTPCKSPEEEFIKEKQIARENIDELHLYGRVKNFFKNTGISTEPGRDRSGSRSYIFYDSKKIFVVKEG